MRIGVFTDSYKPYTSGVVTSITTFKEELTRLGHEVFIFAPSYPQHQEEEPDVYRFLSVPAPTNPEYSLAVPIAPRLSQTVKNLELDILHAHSPFILGRWGANCARRFNLPLVFTYHTLYDQYVHYVPIAQDLARDLAIKYSRNFCNQCDLVITPTREVEELVKSYGIKAPIRVIPTGVPVHKFKNRNPNWLRKNWDIPAEAQVCLFVGRLTKEKNLEFLLQAFRLIKQRSPSAVLVIIASGPLEAELKKMTVDLGLKLDTDVVFTGQIPYENLIDVYFDADLFTFASVTETQGLVLIEAMAAGLPVVAVRAFGVEDMVDDGVNGYLVPLEKGEFVRRVVELWSDDERYRQFSAQALVKAEQMSSAAMARKLETEYREVIKRYHDQEGEKTHLPFPLNSLVK
jgi:1,2-diacylglycerol 3-alpha-glucosyltransferase